MKHKKARLEYDKGCVYCSKPCNFNGLRVDADSAKAAKRNGNGMLAEIKSSEKYGCNSSKLMREGGVS